ncbi:hypothetical protein HIM_10158 [Hirsutella minnesotensis 3608]|uniref:Uncharacterized protein n=1 Tax=Hirsutella minnesotensis 3608 TaxID=1043627 RepID=A0A0F7ZG86_9HYPO|nr:hypothetical protein HIM_10158 [Hirsutella minnesotensis 3608]
MSYYVYRVAYLGAPRNHHAIFIETNADGSGALVHVTGDIQNGMRFEHKAARRPEESASFVEKTLLGWVSTDNYGYIGNICKSIPPPKKQFNGPKRLYPKEPLRRCQEWTNEVVQALFSNGVLQTGDPCASSSADAEYWTWSEEYQNWYHDNGDGSFEWAQAGNKSAGKGKERKGKGKRV